ncbi:MAG: SH3 domain-containing protein [Candidatus Dadabacteria bacterium]|nr:SH3 domain-containing protein [Candidatus Dadabacteria bacterium]
MDNDTAQESVKRISANFELELLRLIKTLNLISQSKELFRTQAAGMEAFTAGHKIRLNDLKAKLARAGEPGAASGDPFAPPAGRPHVPDYLFDITDDIESYLNEIGSDLEKLKAEYLGKLDTVYSVYNIELGASQTDLDTRLRELEKELIGVLSTARAAKAPEPEPAEPEEFTPPPAPEEKTPETAFVPRVDYIGPDPTVDNITTVMPSEKKPEEPAAKAPEKEKEKKEVKAAKPSEQTSPAGFKSPYVMNAVLLFMGLILGVIFYDALMRTWGIQDYTNGKKMEAKAPVSAPVEEMAPEEPEAPGEKAAVTAEKPKAPIAAPKPAEPAAPEEAPAKAEVKVPSAPAPEKAQPETAEVKEDTAAEPAETATESTPEEAPSTTVATTTGAATMYTVTGPGANIRSGPGMRYDVVTEVRGGQDLASTGEVHGRWIQVTVPGGSEGWISSKLLREAQ